MDNFLNEFLTENQVIGYLVFWKENDKDNHRFFSEKPDWLMFVMDLMSRGIKCSPEEVKRNSTENKKVAEIMKEKGYKVEQVIFAKDFFSEKMYIVSFLQINRCHDSNICFVEIEKSKWAGEKRNSQKMWILMERKMEISVELDNYKLDIPLRNFQKCYIKQ